MKKDTTKEPGKVIGVDLILAVPGRMRRPETVAGELCAPVCLRWPPGWVTLRRNGKES